MRFSNEGRVRGFRRKMILVKRPPHPSENAALLCMPSPAGGEDKSGNAAPMATPQILGVADLHHAHPFASRASRIAATVTRISSRSSA
jgi:hypothetical protein